MDKDGIIHLGIGKVSFAIDDLQNNLAAVMSAIRAAKPAGAKGTYIKRMSLASTMGPGIKIDLNSV